jgi:hypothetical protein
MGGPASLAQIRAALLLLATAALAACGGGGGGNGPALTSTPSGVGGTVVTLTDAPGDFLNYMVKVSSLQLTRTDGTVVETLPVTANVDFSQLVNLSEIVSTAQVPVGRYVSVKMTVDFGGATVVVDSGAGPVTIAADNIVNGATSLPLNAPNPTTMALTLMLPSNAPLVVTQGTVAHLALDFNLAASNAITPSATSPTTVTVNPVLTGSLVPDTTRQARIRGTFVSADAAAGSYIINVRPFDDDSGGNGQFTVQTTSSTAFNVNGASLNAAAGLAQLTAGMVTAAYGTLNLTTKTFTASSVLAGSSVAGTKLDSVTGTVLSRSGSTLIIANGTERHADADDMVFAHQVTATIGVATAVTELGQAGAFTVQDISVGQRVQLSGKLGADSGGNKTIDATAGGALLLPTTLSGTAVSTTAGVVTVNLQSIDGQMPSSLNFAGTGATTAQDAKAAAYTVAVPSALSTTPAAAGTPVRFSGFVSPFGAAPPDFNAANLISFANTKAVLEVRWASPGVSTPFATLLASELLLSQATLTASEEHELKISFSRSDPSALAAGLQLVPDGAAINAAFAIGHRSTEKAESFTTFSDFVTALTTDLGTNTALGLEAVGPYNAATGVLSVDQMVVILNN